MDYFDITRESSAEDRQIQRAAHAFARDVMRPIGKQLDRMAPAEVIAEGSPLWSFLAQAYDLGYHKALVPEAWGGLGLPPGQACLLFEELAWGSAGLATLLGAACVPFLVASLFPDPRLVEEFVVPFCECRDGSVRGCWAITEPDHGSDFFAKEPFFQDPRIRNNVQARRDGDTWIVDGQKSAWVSGGTIATHALLFCQIDPGMGLAGGGICLTPLDREGVSRGAPLDKLGCRDLNQGEIYFDSVRIPAHYMICEPSIYTGALEMLVAIANASMGIGSAGLARAAFEEALAFAKSRIQGGVPIIEHRSVRQRLFEMFSKVETCRVLSRVVADLNFKMSPPFAEYSILAKTMCTQLGFEVASEAVQIHGGAGLSREYLVEKLFRDARAGLIGDGCNETLQAYGGKILAETYPRTDDRVAA